MDDFTGGSFPRQPSALFPTTTKPEGTFVQGGGIDEGNSQNNDKKD